MEKQENKVLERAVNERTPLEEREESPYEMYGWEFHKRAVDVRFDSHHSLLRVYFLLHQYLGYNNGSKTICQRGDRSHVRYRNSIRRSG